MEFDGFRPPPERHRSGTGAAHERHMSGTGAAHERHMSGTAPEPPPSPEHVFCDICCDLKPQGFLPPAAKANEKYPLLPHPGILDGIRWN